MTYDEAVDLLDDLTHAVLRPFRFCNPDDTSTASFSSSEMIELLIRRETSEIRLTDDMTHEEVDSLLSDALNRVIRAIDYIPFLDEDIYPRSTPMKPKYRDPLQAVVFLTHLYECETDIASEPLVNHPIDVMNELRSADITDETTLIAALLHDVEQYSDVTHEEIAFNFSDDVARLVTQLTVDQLFEKDQIEEEVLKMSRDLRGPAQDIFIADLKSNIKRSCLGVISDEKTERLRLAWLREVIENLTQNEPHQLLISSLNTELDRLYIERRVTYSRTETRDQIIAETDDVTA